MQRIIFGAIWLTGFLAVLLSWGMMWGRTQGDGPRRMLGKVASTISRCQYEVINPANGTYHTVQEDSRKDCGFTELGWTANQEWFYFQKWIIDQNGLPFSEINRIDRNLQRQEIVATDIPSARGYLSPDGRNLIVTGSDGWQVVDSDNLEASYRIYVDAYRGSYSLRAFSPDGHWMILTTRTDVDGWRNYLARLDGSEIYAIAESWWLGIVMWTETPQWLVLFDMYSWDGRHDITQVSKMRPIGGDGELLAWTAVKTPNGGSYEWSADAPFFSKWAHNSGIVGLMTRDRFDAMWVDTGEILWSLQGVERVYTGFESDDPDNLDKDWVHFKMIDGRLARCRFDGSDLTFYDLNSLPVLQVWGWSPDGEWVWFETPTSNPDLSDVYRVQRDGGRMELIANDMAISYFGFSPDFKWAYYQNQTYYLSRLRLDGTGQPKIVLRDEPGYYISWTPPYQAEWQPTRTLIIGIGLMSFSTLTPIVLWRRRHKQRTA